MQLPARAAPTESAADGPGLPHEQGGSECHPHSAGDLQARQHGSLVG